MSWTKVQDPYRAFEQTASATHAQVAFARWTLEVWEKTNDHPEGRWFLEKTPSCLRVKASIRIILAPLDLPRVDSLPQVGELYRIFDMPRDFTTERLQSVSHSFRRSTDRHGSSSWFHFLCKNIEVKQEANAPPQIYNRAANMGYHVATLPQADYSYHRSGFFLRTDSGGSVTLLCLGATPWVRQRLIEFTTNHAWEDVPAEPYIMFDLVLDGLYSEVDGTVWNMNKVFGPLEHLILEFSEAKNTKKMSSKIPFAAMHNCAKHVIHIAEALESCLMLVDSTLENIGDHDHIPETDERRSVTKQLRECLKYRRSLFRSSQLRLNSLQKRIDNAITLSFNMVTQQDSMVMIQDSNSMKIIAAITMIFLPTTGVATVVGSQLFVTNPPNDKTTWEILTTPLFRVMWWIAIPLTFFVVLLAMSWHWWTHTESPRGEVVHVYRKARAATFRSTKKEG